MSIYSSIRYSARGPLSPSEKSNTLGVARLLVFSICHVVFIPLLFLVSSRPPDPTPTRSVPCTVDDPGGIKIGLAAVAAFGLGSAVWVVKKSRKEVGERREKVHRIVRFISFFVLVRSNQAS
jgi:hypothetical protein